MKNAQRNQPGARDSDLSIFLERLGAILQADHLAEALDSLARPGATCFRWNSLIGGDQSTTIDSLSIPFEKFAWFDRGYWTSADSRQSLLESTPVRDRRIYVQNASSFLPCLVLNPRPEEQVLDLAAAPGGKTLLLAELMENQGWISAVEPVRNRFFKLKTNLQDYGCTIAHLYQTDGRSVGRKVPGRFDRILLDAPCSGEARIRTNDPETYRFWSLRKIREQARKQAGLIRSAFQSLRPGGILVYCTCSFAPEENEMIVSRFLDKTKDARLIPPTIDGAPVSSIPGIRTQPGLTRWNNKDLYPEINRTLRIVPDEIMDGFFLACLTKDPA